MWKKDDPQSPMPSTPGFERPSPPPDTSRSPAVSGEKAAIGRSITIKGEVTGNEDLLIQGQVNGSVDLKKQTVTVGREGQVKADIQGRIVTVEGEVEGNLTAEEQVVLRGSARVHGDIKAPRVVLEDGAVFRGGIDMGDPPPLAKPSAGGSSVVSKAPPEAPKSDSPGTKVGSDGEKDTGGGADKAKP